MLCNQPAAPDFPLKTDERTAHENRPASESCKPVFLKYSINYFRMLDTSALAPQILFFTFFEKDCRRAESPDKR